jgi:hypothetical protein
MQKHLLLAIAAAVALVGAGSYSKADTLQVAHNHTQFGTPSDFVFWGQLGATGTAIPNGFTATSVGGIGVTGVFSGRGQGIVGRQCPFTGCDWAGNFAPGDALLWTGVPGQGPVTLSFSQGVSGAGFQIQADYFGKFNAELQAFNGPNLLATFFDTGNSNGQEDNSAIFFGVLDLTGADITSIKIGTFACTQNCGDFAINQLWLNPSPSTSTPEPATMMLLSSGLGLLGFLRRKLA